MTFQELFRKVHSVESPSVFKGTLLSLDPGHTTGYCTFHTNAGDVVEPVLRTHGEINTKDINDCAPQLLELIQWADVVVVEDYRIYRWRQKEHAWSDLLTTRLIGSIEVLATQCWDSSYENIPVIKQPANVAKSFCTDAKLKEWDFWVTGQRHARDAIRHACYFLLFGGTDEWAKRKQSQSTVG